MRRCAAVGVMLFVATLRGLSVPLPAGCDDLLDRYAAECRLPRFDLDEDGELVFLPGRAHAACAELRASLEAGCVRWRSAKIGHLFRVWWAQRQAERVRREDAERRRWLTTPACSRDPRRHGRADRCA